MSRHVAVKNGYEYAWGYDEPLQSYFFQKFKQKGDEEECIFSIDTYFSDVTHPSTPEKRSYSNGEMIEVMEEEGVVPDEHLNAIAGDLKF